MTKDELQEFGQQVEKAARLELNTSALDNEQLRDAIDAIHKIERVDNADPHNHSDNAGYRQRGHPHLQHEQRQGSKVGNEPRRIGERMNVVDKTH